MLTTVAGTGIAQSTTGADEHTLIRRAASLGVAGVEPMISSIDSPYLSWTADDIIEFRKQAEKLQVHLPSTAVSIFNNDDSLVTSNGLRRAISVLRQSLALSALLGAETMLLCTYGVSNPDTLQKKANLLEVIRCIESLAKELRVAIGLESPLPADELSQLVDEVSSEYVGIYYDVGNAIFLGHNPAREIAQLGNSILSVHIKDSMEYLGDSHLGNGLLDLSESMSALADIDYSGWLILETPAGNDDAIRRDIQLIREFVR